MHEILTTTRATLTDRGAELEALIKAGEEQCQAIADEGNRQIKAITDKAAADIGGINAELEKHVTELAGVQHSIGTIDAIAEATHSESPKDDPRDPDQPMTDAEAAEEAEAMQRKAPGVAPLNGSIPMSLAEAGAAMQRLQHQHEALSLDGSNSVVTRLTEKKQP